MKRNKFSLSHYNLLTLNCGQLIPVTWFETIPGDSVQQVTSALIRTQALEWPVMHPLHVRFHHWWVTLSQIWDDYEDFFTGGEDGKQTPTHPHLDLGTVAEGDLLDYLGIPPHAYGGGGNMEVSALPLRAYQKIYDEHYRDQQLNTSPTIATASGADSTTTSSIQSVCWPKDYLTTAREDETLGDDINIPLLGTAPITGLGTANQSFVTGPGNAYETDGTGATSYANYHAGARIEEDPSNAGFPNIRADLTAATGASINDVRLSLALQRFQEARQQYGARYPELLRHLGVTPDDQSLRRPIYLGGGRQTIGFSERTATDSTNTGDMYGHGLGAMKTNRYRKFFNEHGIVMTMMSVVPKPIYGDAIDRKWLRTVKEEYFVRELQHLGEQIVYNKEVYSKHSTPDGTHGYQSRYDEYRGCNSRIAGEFRSSMDHAHMARIFTGDTALNSAFVSCVPTNRIYKNTSSNQLYVMAMHSIQARRPIIKHGRPMTF